MRDSGVDVAEKVRERFSVLTTQSGKIVILILCQLALRAIQKRQKALDSRIRPRQQFDTLPQGAAPLAIAPALVAIIRRAQVLQRNQLLCWPVLRCAISQCLQVHHQVDHVLDGLLLHCVGLQLHDDMEVMGCMDLARDFVPQVQQLRRLLSEAREDIAMKLIEVSKELCQKRGSHPQRGSNESQEGLGLSFLPI